MQPCNILFRIFSRMSFILRFLQSGSLSHTGNLLAEEAASFNPPPTLASHKILLPYLLTFGLDLGLFFSLYQSRKLCAVLHAVICGLIALAALATTLPLLVRYQIPSGGWMQAHAVIGLLLIVLVLLQLAAGVAGRALQCFSVRSSYGLYLINRVHRINGYAFALLAKAEVYLALDRAGEDASLAGLLGVDALLLVLLAVRKGTRAELQSLGTPEQEEGEVEVEAVESVDLISKGRTVGVFANYIYDISPLLRFHPMGFEIIAAARGRDFERFLFGSAPTERLPSIPPHAHSLRALALLPPPLARLAIPPVYGCLEEMSAVRVKELVRISERGEMYEVRLLRRDGGGFPCLGYSSVRQLGRYFVLNLDGRVSRLYITVSFLAPRNLRLLEQLYFRPRKLALYSIAMNPYNHRPLPFGPAEEGAATTERELRSREREDYLPLYIKKYPGGALTSRLLEQEFCELRLSEQRGEGLRLQAVVPGRVVVFIGGTGIIPFGDLIDLLFKAVLLQAHPEYRPLVLAQNPILATDSLRGFSFRFFLEEHFCEDIHPLTRAQLIELVRYPALLEFHLKCHARVEDARLRRSAVRMVAEGLEEMVRAELAREDCGEVTQYWVCCSPALSAKVIGIFEERGVPEEKFVFL